MAYGIPTAVQALHRHSQAVDEVLLPCLLLLGWEHTNLTGDYSCVRNGQLADFSPCGHFPSLNV